MQRVKGTRDFLPKEAIARQAVISKIRQAYARYGFQPLSLPALEARETLRTKVSEEILGLMYEFKDKAGRDIGLRYDFTTGLARLAASVQLPIPFKCSQIGRVWRYERPQASRYREFWQADIDIIGVKGPEADVQCLAAACAALQGLGLNFFIRVNSRKLLSEIALKSGFKKTKLIKIFQAIDKLDKIGLAGVCKELLKLASSAIVTKLLAYFKLTGSSSSVLKKLSKDLGEKEGITELIDIFELAKRFGILDKLKLDLSLARGLAYYTGAVFEISAATKLAKKSIGGGGRYDDLIEAMGGKPVAATGLSLGIDRIIDVLAAQGLLPDISTQLDVYVIPIDARDDAIKLVQQLRREGINADLDLQRRGVTKNLDFANKQRIPAVVFLGKEELKKRKFKLRDMLSGKEQLLSLRQLIIKLKK